LHAGGERDDVERHAEELEYRRGEDVVIARRDRELPVQAMAEATDPVGLGVTEAGVRAAEYRERAQRRLHLGTREGAAHAHPSGVAEEGLPPVELREHERVAVHPPVGSEAARTRGCVRCVQPMHDIAALEVDRAEVLEEADEGAVDVEWLPPR